MTTTTRHGSAIVTLPSDREILIERSFDAPAALVWDALTQPRHLLRWWGPDYCPLVACDVDFRVGGDWRYLARDMDGNELGWHGTYREIEPTLRIVSSEVFEGFPEAESVNTMTLTEHAGVTILRTLVLHQTTEYRDGHVASGMEGGMQLTFNRLDDLLAAASTTAERFRRVAGRFTDRANEVPPGAWDNPAPCDGWTARDVVDHLVSWVPGFFGSAGIDIAAGPSVDDDPAGAWRNLADQLQGFLDDPDMAAREIDGGPAGPQTVESAIGMIVLGDVLVHTWDIARATGLDETLDADIVTEMLIGMQPIDDMLRQSGHYGPKVAVDEGADDQTKLIAFTGRTPLQARAMASDDRPTAQRFVERLDAIATDDERVKLQRYFKSGEGEYGEGDEFIGVRMGSVFALADEFRAMPLDEVEALLESSVHEAHAGAVKIMAKQAAARTATDDARRALVDLYLRRIDRINNWDLVDLGAWDVIGRYLVDKPRDLLGDLAGSTNLWERRTAILATLFFVRRDDLDDAFAIAGRLLGDDEDLIHKAVGGVLRECGKRDPPRLVAFLDDNAASMPRTALRYAIEHLEPDARAHYRSLRATEEVRP